MFVCIYSITLHLDPELFQNNAETEYDTATEDILRRPSDLIYTVHKMKEIELTVDYDDDVEQERLQKNKRK